MKIDERNERIIRIYDDIDSGEISLQPDFQRGEVWPSSKKKLLIDSILRRWHIPPVHVVVMDDGTYEVLDGQQRLTAIRDFIDNRFAIDGNIEPKDDNIKELHGKRYRDLEGVVKREFDRFTLKINEINDYNSGEPSELFHRLNQTIKLTSSEARNAIYGSVRNSIAELVDEMDEKNINRDILGFSNSRMAYNDLLSRVIVFLESGSLRAKISESSLNNRYRADEAVDVRIITSISASFDVLNYLNEVKDSFELLPQLTKASSLNWIYLACTFDINNIDFDIEAFSDAFFSLELARAAVKSNEKIPAWIIEHFDLDEVTLREVVLLYIERSSSRVMSIGSILIRDLIQLLSLSRSIDNLPLNNEDITLLKHTFIRLKENQEPKTVLEDTLAMWRNLV